MDWAGLGGGAINEHGLGLEAQTRKEGDHYCRVLGFAARESIASRFHFRESRDFCDGTSYYISSHVTPNTRAILSQQCASFERRCWLACAFSYPRSQRKEGREGQRLARARATMPPCRSVVRHLSLSIYAVV